MKFSDMVDKISEQHVAILGKTGAGKTWAAKTIVEHLLSQKRQVCVLDPTGAWYGLRLGRDGKSKGFDVVLLGGKHADIPLAEKSGPAVARLVTEQRASVVIDTSGLTVGEYTRWFIGFAGTLYTTMKNPLHLVIDECHYFMPQGKSPDVDAGKMLHAGNRLMSGGRSLGIRGIMITQRPAKLHKDSLTCADTLIAMRVLAPQDRQAVKDWVDGCGDAVQGRAVLDSLAQLQRGEGWVWYPEGTILLRTKFPDIKTYDSSATPKHGQVAAPSVREINLDKVKSAMAEAVKEAEANDPKLLRAKIVAMEQQLKTKHPKIAAAPAAKVDPNRDERLIALAKKQVMCLFKKQAHGVTVGLAVLVNEAEKLAHLTKANSENSRKFRDLIEATLASDASAPPLVVSREADHHAIAKSLTRFPSPVDVNRLPVASKRRDDNGDDEVTTVPSKGKMREMLIAMAQRDGLTSAQIGVRAGMSSSSGTFGTYLSIFRKNDWMRDDGDKRYITDEGREALGEYEPLPTGSELLKHWKNELGGKLADMLEGIAKAYPGRITKEDLGEAVGMSSGSGTFGTYLSKLRTLELISRKGDLRASDELFDHPEPE